MTPNLIVVTVDSGIVRTAARKVYVNASLIRYLYPSDSGGCTIYFDDEDKLSVTETATAVANMMLGKTN